MRADPSAVTRHNVMNTKSLGAREVPRFWALSFKGMETLRDGGYGTQLTTAVISLSFGHSEIV
jgi:hypothetical protein